MTTSLNVRGYLRKGSAAAVSWRLASGDDPDDARREPVRLDRLTSGREDLPYKVELWDEARQSVEQLAVTASGSVGYAAFYAATREYPNRYITLRHKNSIVSRWNAAGH